MIRGRSAKTIFITAVAALGVAAAALPEIASADRVIIEGGYGYHDGYGHYRGSDRYGHGDRYDDVRWDRHYAEGRDGMWRDLFGFWHCRDGRWLDHRGHWHDRDDYSWRDGDGGNHWHHHGHDRDDWDDRGW